MKIKYVKPFITIIEMEMEQVMASISNPSVTERSQQGMSSNGITEETSTEEDVTDFTKNIKSTKNYSVWK